MILFLTAVSSCTPSTNSRRAAPSNSNDSNTGDSGDSTDDSDTLSEISPFFQYDNTSYPSNFLFPSDFNDTLELRGSFYDRLVESNPTTSYCAVFYFPTISGGTKLILPAYPRSQRNATSGVRTSYLDISFRTNDSDIALALCDNANVRSAANSINAGTNKFSLQTLCPTCTNANYRSTDFLLLDSSGNLKTTEVVTNLSIEARYSFSNDTSVGSCTVDSQCTTQGFDCCLNNQCVTDGELKQTYTSGDPEYNNYIQALIDVANNPVNKSKYPEYYFICGNSPPPSDGGGSDDGELTPEEEAALYFNELKYLYECTNPVDGEMSICSVEYDNLTASDTSFQARDDDRDFSITYTGTLTPPSSVYEIIYQNASIFKDEVYTSSPSDAVIAGSNDVLTSAAFVTIGKTFDEDSKYKTAIIRYRVDGSCEVTNTNIATCYKEYVQGQNIGKPTDHFPPTDPFYIPTYYDSARTVVVEVDGIKYVEGTDYTLIKGATPAQVVFTSRPIDTQRVRISYSVDLNSNPVLLSRNIALQRIGEICSCPENNCSLGPVLDDDGLTVNYQCLPPEDETPSPPIQIAFTMSSKHVPHLHFDTNGLKKTDLSYTDIAENPVNEQEGTAFEYTNNNPLSPNNSSTYIGFNEIYDSFTYLGGSALPAKEIEVERNKTYDIFVDDGNISNCDGCGYDYYSTFTKLFPNTFSYSAGGYFPDYSSSDKTKVERYRADDQAYGRSCYVPATMLPWSHQDEATVQDQRLTRLKTQHFLFANGYQRDWYGFDYGAMIGSFDGVKWFAIGTQRRIKAKSNRLYLAFNSYFGDLTLENNTFDVLIQDSVINPTLDPPRTDFETDGAECQQAHVCEKDSDCAAMLGFDYYCADVTEISSNYPRFDENGKEIPNSSESLELFDLIVTNNGGNKRCIYRGRGALCEANHNSASSSSFHGTEEKRQSACSANNYCQAFTVAGADQAKFNTAIHRVARSATVINSQTSATTFYSTSGFLAPIIGRTQEYIGTDTIDGNVKNNLTNNNVLAMCLPGRDTTSSFSTETFGSINSLGDADYGDAMQNVGLTRAPASTSDYMNLSCPAFDEDGNEIKFTNSADTIVSQTPLIHHNAQNISINNLTAFAELDLEDDIVKDFVRSASSTDDSSNPLATGVAFQSNMCLRAPGATCFSNLDCAANSTLSNRASSLDGSGTANFYEREFWSDDLICAQPAKFGEEDYDVRNNRCCRDEEKNFYIPFVENTLNTSISLDGSKTASQIDVSSVPGVSISLTSANRLSQNAIVANESLATEQDFVLGQKNIQTVEDVNVPRYKGVDAMAKKSCCSENWIRNFKTGGHQWRPEKFNNIDLNNFKEKMECFNYFDLDSDGNITDSDCGTVGSPTCEAANIPTITANQILKWLSNIELIGIPNVIIKDAEDLGSAFLCKDDRTTTSYSDAIIAQDRNSAEVQDGLGDRYHYLYPKDSVSSEYDTGQYSNLIVEQTFSEDEFSCCRPAGSFVGDNEDENVCCTGYKNPVTKRCALDENVSVNLYLNRFISSEANNLPDALFDPQTGYLLDKTKVAEIACFKNLCASGFLVEGVAYGKYQIRNSGNADIENKEIYRFIEGPVDNKMGDAERGIWNYFSDGLRWNNHYYCVTQDVATAISSDEELGNKVISCN